jgi:hypothetical protein
MKDRFHPPTSERPSDAIVESQTRLWSLEEKRDLLRFTVDGWSVWPLLRTSVSLGFRGAPFDKVSNKDRWRRSEWLGMALKDLVRVPALRKARYLVVASSANRRSQEKNGLYKDVYFDELLLNVGSYVKIEYAGSRSFATNSQSALIKGDITSSLIEATVGLLSRLGPRSVSEIAMELGPLLQREGLETWTSQKITKVLRGFFWRKKLYKWLLARIQPECLLLIYAYGDHAVVAAAKERGVPVLELQHGFVSRYHPGYSWSPYALPYRRQMPIPDKVLLYGDYWKQELEANGFWGQELRTVGSLQIDEFRHHKPEADHSCIIVVTTQGLDTQRLVDFLSDFMAMAHGKLSFRLYVKLRREPTKEPYRSALGAYENVCVVLGSEPPFTFDLLSTADLHVSICSTAHYEALALGAPTIILPFEGHLNVLHLCETGYAFLAETPEDMLDIVLHWQHTRVPDAIGEFYFKADALKRMRAELDMSQRRSPQSHAAMDS